MLLLDSISNFSIALQQALNPESLLVLTIAIGSLGLIAAVIGKTYKNIQTIPIENRHKEWESELLPQLKITSSVLLYGSITILFFYFLYHYIKAAHWEAHAMEWLNLIVRWAHMILGIAWIGASFYFIFLENSLNRHEDLRDELAGNLWAIHGGGFYYLEKYKVSPKELPKKLHWFKFEAYFTWLTGFLLLCIVYYMNAKAFLIDKNVMDIQPRTAILIGLSSMALGWIVYDQLCKSSLINKQKLFATILFIFVTAVSWGLCQVFNSRAAYIHVGAMLGTIMVANVFFVIIPSQKQLVKAAAEGKIPDPALGKKAGLRSLHNNYFTLPVLFIMISNHFPSTFGNQFNWIILIALAIGSILIKHYWNLSERGIYPIWMVYAAIAIVFILFFVTAPKSTKMDLSKPVSFEEVNQIIQKRCTPCHSSKPTDDEWTTAPNGLVFDTPDHIVNMIDKIKSRAIDTRSMPQANKTNMTQEERDMVAAWINQGAKIK
jgi:uncharacterized membrane protein